MLLGVQDLLFFLDDMSYLFVAIVAAVIKLVVVVTFFANDVSFFADF